MSTWISETDGPLASRQVKPGGQALLRLTDVALAGLLLLLLALPLLLAWALGRPRREAVLGVHGQPFERLGLMLPKGLLGRALAGLGAADWPVLWHILRGQMAWVGPRLRSSGEELPAALAGLRPGLINPWFIRRHTAVDFGSEADADAQYLAQRGPRHDLGLLLRGALVAALPARRGLKPARVQVGDVVFDNVTMNEALSRVRDMLDGGTAQQVSFVNPACVNIAAGHRGYRRTLARAGLVLPDGIGIKIGSDLLGTPLKQNVNGTDLFPRLCSMLEARRSSVFLLGGQPGVAEAVAAEIAKNWPGLRVAGLRHGFFTVAEEGAVAAEVRATAADLLLVARGVPAQDLFIDRYLPQLGVKVAMGVGGLFDFASGRIARAPQWMRETGLEWVYRLMQEPGRMWRRYLIGNFSFLARVMLQRLGLRQPAGDIEPPHASGPAIEAQRPGLRAVLFANRRVPSDLPLPADHPAAALPLGCQSIIEHLMDQLSQAAVTDVDLVVSDRPELLRGLLGDGERWGLTLHWHLAKDPGRPYGILAGLAAKGARRILIGHADVALATRDLMRLSCLNAVSVQADELQGSRWSSWACVTPRQLGGLPEDLDSAALYQALLAAGVPPLMGCEVSVWLDSAKALLQAQFGDGERDLQRVPAAWLRHRWGAMSPTARVHPSATMIGPVLIGPGCVVEAGAKVGPHVVLSRDVIVSRGSSVEHSLLLPQTYVGAELDLAHSVVNGSRVRHVLLDVDASPAAADALLLSLTADKRRQHAGRLMGRALAGLALLLLWPLLALHLGLCRWSGRSKAWLLRPVVSGRHQLSLEPQFSLLHCPNREGSRLGRVWAGAAGLIDVARGARSWIGMRPRSRSQWYALRPEWQQILASAPVGLLHAPVWIDDPALLDEASAAADVFCAVQSPLGRLRLALRSGWFGAAKAKAKAKAKD
ncbi:WecB/TagA/CpsF family glycosyltransferase [Roseateles oligotrophus]|uniref:WecB/TagA/CpsF family glycosyltransferase n=1 Tax=Roseateles oligotrophus TaxID=1769250 RepID=A0ABT2YFS7_9BURK|nr:WecB/TagA/CpsF family glycosyltransferase [Roseateles oligotrophus]MCV2368894.1 WecB/TagA/CpsF family glycosyltransferase [Roseateles oligotrophus]